MRETVLVTGGLGFIGYYTCKLLIRMGYKVVIIDNLSSGELSRMNSMRDHAELVIGDINVKSEIENAMQGVDKCIHLAAQVSVDRSFIDPVQSCETNTIGFINVLEAARKYKVNNIVYASSAAVYGDRSFDVDGTAEHEAGTYPMSPYGIEKVSNELYGSVFNISYGMITTGLRYFNVYGIGQNEDSPYTGVITKFMDRLSKDIPIHIYGDGNQKRDFVHVEDVARANVLALENEAVGVFNIGTGKTISITELFALITSISGIPATPLYGDERKGDIYLSKANPELARQYLEFSYDIGLEEGLRDLINHKGLLK